MSAPRRSDVRWLSLLRQIVLMGLPLLLRLLQGNQRRGSASSRPSASKRCHGTTSRSTSSGGRKTTSTQRRRTLPARGRKLRSPLARLAAQKAQEVLVTDQGTIVKVLPDDNHGSRHQRFLVEVHGTDLTVKISHNIDLAPRVPAVEGEELIFRGDYAWNELGGYVHWTHHDPKKWREGGWIEHRGKRYE